MNRTLSPAPRPISSRPSQKYNLPVCLRDAFFDIPEHERKRVLVQRASRLSKQEYVRVTVKVPKILRDILRSCAKSTHQYQYVLVIEALAEFLVHLPREIQRHLLQDVNGETPEQYHADVRTTTWKRLWNRLFRR
jgi:hypothetical protein